LPSPERDAHGHVRDVVARHRGHATVARWPADDPVAAGEQREHVQVEAVAQEGVAHAAGADVLLGMPVVAGEGEGGVRGAGQERRVDDALHAGRHGRVDGAGVQPHPVDRLGRRDQQQRVHAVEGAAHGLAVAVGGPHDLGARKLWRPGGVADDQALGHATVGEAARDAPAEPAGHPGDRHRRHRRPSHLQNADRVTTSRRSTTRAEGVKM
jgi:hypothetical protein